MAGAISERGAIVGLPSPEFLARVTHDFARRHLVLSGGVRDGAEVLRTAARTKSLVAFNIGVRLGRPVEAIPEPDEALAAAIDTAYGSASPVPTVVVEGSDELELDLARAVRDTEADLLSTQGKAPAIRLVDLVLFEALRMEASDVHVQPTRDRTLVRFRLDGALRTVRELPASLASAVVGRIKVMARLDVAERRSPQDGRAGVTVGGSGGGGTASTRAGRRVDLRVSILPTTFGERVVIRLLDPSHSPHVLTFAALGMPPEIESRFLEQVGRPSGIVLATGPTGSGKTTTLYTTLAWVSATNSGLNGAAGAAPGGRAPCELNIVTVEDPVEYDLSGSGLSVNALTADPALAGELAGALFQQAERDMIALGKVVRDRETPAAVRVEAIRVRWQIGCQLTERLQSLGLLPETARQVRADLTHRVGEPPGVEALQAQFTEIETLLNELAGDEAARESTAALRLTLGRLRIAEGLGELRQSIESTDTTGADHGQPPPDPPVAG